MRVGLMFFGNFEEPAPGVSLYDAVIRSAVAADRAGLDALWFPERHYHRFGGAFPSPTHLAAAVSQVTERISLRAGSVVAPLHDALPIVEQWAVVDNLSGGRVGVSFASGWSRPDFVLHPDRYETRKEILLQRLVEVRDTWRSGRLGDTEVYPRPVQPELPLWLTAAGSPSSFVAAGEHGVSVLTHLLGHSLAELAVKIEQYRDAFRPTSPDGSPHVTVMLHTHIAERHEEAVADALAPMIAYVSSSADLSRSELKDGTKDSSLAAIARAKAAKLVAHSSLIGDRESVEAFIEELGAIGVDEVACLVDFGLPTDRILRTITHLGQVRGAATARLEPDPA